MVIKTDLCSFSEFRIYPGHGTKFVRKDGQLLTFITSKSSKLYHQKKKPAKLTWTLAWRRLNKKEQREGQAKRKKRRTVRTMRPVVGMAAETIRKKRSERPQQRVAAREAALKEVKQRNAKKKGKK